jgi:hypothetical protein
VKAVFVREFALETSVMAQGIVTPSGGIYDQDTEVILTATPASGWAFLRWLATCMRSRTPAFSAIHRPISPRTGVDCR